MRLLGALLLVINTPPFFNGARARSRGNLGNDTYKRPTIQITTDNNFADH